MVEVDHPVRGKYLTVGNPVKMSNSITEVKRSPLLGEHTEEILSKVLGYSAKEVAEIKARAQSPRRRSRPRPKRRRLFSYLPRLRGRSAREARRVGASSMFGMCYLPPP